MLYNSLHCPVVPGRVQDFNCFNSVNWLYRPWNPFCFSELLISFTCNLWVWNVMFRLVLFSVIHNVAVETKPFLGVSCTRSTFLKWLPDEGKDIFRWYDEKKHECSVSHVFLCVIALPLSGTFEGHKLKLAWGFLGVNFWSRDFFGFCWKP